MQNHTNPRPTRIALAGTLAVVALAALGCSTTEQTDPSSGGVPRLRPATDLRPADSLPGDPHDLDQATVRKLDPELRAAVDAAARDAAEDGVTIIVTSGWRSRAHQQRLYDEAVDRYGSEDEARRYVNTPDTSAHVTGDAVDIGPKDADHWLVEHGSAYGLCQTFANEIWHFELATTPGGECPEMLPDGSYRG